MATKKGLGKGLDALFFDNATQLSNSTGTEQMKLSEIEPNRNQPRKAFEDEPLQQLADSIREHGLIQPLLVRPLQTGGYQIVAGERRWRASRMAGLTEVPVIIRDIDDVKTMELALIENLQRENLNAVEEALGYKELMDTYHMTQADVSKSVGKSRSAIANTLRLLNLPEDIVDYVRSGELTSGHARSLVALEDESKMRELAERAVRQGLSVREIERLAKAAEQPTLIKSIAGMPKATMGDSFYKEIELSIKEELVRKAKIKVRDDDTGTLEFAFYSRDDLQDFVKLLIKAQRD